MLDPANNGNGSGSGSGQTRRWTAEDVAALRVCGRLAELGAGTDVMASAVSKLRLYPLVMWGGQVWVTSSGDVWDEPPHGALCARWIDLDAVVRDLPIA